MSETTELNADLLDIRVDIAIGLDGHDLLTFLNAVEELNVLMTWGWEELN